MSDPKSKEFWDQMRKAAAPMKGLPAWAHAGITLNPHNFETGQQCKCETCKERYGDD